MLVDKNICTLSVPEGTITAYQQADQWKDFLIIDNNITGVGTMTSGTGMPTIIYELNGRKNSETKHGLNIIRMGDGTMKKVVVK